MNPMGRGSGFVKFLVVPAAVAAIGFFVLGPYLGRSPKLTKMVREKAAQFVPGVTQTPNTLEPPAGQDRAETTPSSQVSVDVRPLPDSAPAETPRRRRRHSN
jgi:hypothetical protein